MISLEFLAVFAMLTGNLEIKIGLAIEVEDVFVGYHYWKKSGAFMIWRQEFFTSREVVFSESKFMGVDS